MNKYYRIIAAALAIPILHLVILFMDSLMEVFFSVSILSYFIPFLGYIQFPDAYDEGNRVAVGAMVLLFIEATAVIILFFGFPKINEGQN